MSIDANDAKRFKELFDSLDINKDGVIESKELADAMKKQAGGKLDVTKHADKVMSRADEDSNTGISFDEFILYMQKHEQKLKLAFSDLDKNKDGRIEPSEIMESLTKLGLNLSVSEAEQLTKRIDKDGSLSLDWEEWRNFFQLHPSDDLESMVSYWRQCLMIDIGDNLTCPPEFTKKEKVSGMWWRHLVAGGLAGIVSRTATAPLDRLKVFMQVHGAKAGNQGLIANLRNMIKEGGVKSLWRGNGTNIIKIAPESAIKFGAYEQIKKWMKGDSTKNISVVERFASGSMAGAFSQTCIYPMEVIKTRLAIAKTGEFKGMLDCGIKIYKKNGFKALYRGYIPNIVGIIPYAGIDLTVYESLKIAYLKRNPDQKDPGVMVLLGCGTLSSTCGQLATYPIALIKTKLQAGMTEEARQGIIPLTKHIIRKEGFLGLYRGIAPNFLKVLPAVSISYVIYERAKTTLKVS